MDQIHCDLMWYWIGPLNQKMVDMEILPEFHCAWIDAEWIALFLYACKEWPDSADDFPSGKWASIQALEYRLQERVAAELLAHKTKISEQADG